MRFYGTALAIGGLLACSVAAAERTGDLKKLQGVWTVTDMKCIGLDDSKVTGQAIFVIEATARRPGEPALPPGLAVLQSWLVT